MSDMHESGASETRSGEGVVTPWELVEVDGLQAWRCLLDSRERWQGRTWYRAIRDDTEGMAFPRLTNAEMPDEQFFEDVGHLLNSKTHPRILIPSKLLSTARLCRVRQADLRGWISGQGHPDPSIAVPADSILKLVDGARDHGPGSYVDGDPARWVGAAVRLLGKYTIREFCRDEPGEERHLRAQLREIQKRLASEGVLPWAAYDRAIIPATWQTDGTLEPALQQWRREATAIDAMQSAIDGLVTGLSVFERTRDADLARTMLRVYLRRVA